MLNNFINILNYLKESEQEIKKANVQILGDDGLKTYQVKILSPKELKGKEAEVSTIKYAGWKKHDTLFVAIEDLINIKNLQKSDLNNELKEIEQQLKSMKGGYDPSIHNDENNKAFISRRQTLIDRKSEILALLKK